MEFRKVGFRKCVHDYSWREAIAAGSSMIPCSLCHDVVNFQELGAGTNLVSLAMRMAGRQGYKELLAHMNNGLH